MKSPRALLERPRLTAVSNRRSLRLLVPAAFSPILLATRLSIGSPPEDCACEGQKAFEYWGMKLKVLVTPKAAVLDPQGAAVRDAMQHLGMPEVSSVRIGKYLEIEVDDKTPNLDARLEGLCRDLLSNPVIEDYQVVK